MKNLVSKPAFMISVIAVVAIAAIIYGYTQTHRSIAYNYVTAQTADITQGANITGTVQSVQDLNLNFQRSDKIASVQVNTGDSVKSGQVLASLDMGSVSAQISAAKAAVQTAQANFEKVLDGASSSQISVSQAAVQSAQVALNNAVAAQKAAVSQQQTLVNNAKSAMLNAGLAATINSDNSATATASISGTYTGSDQGSYLITIALNNAGYQYNYSGLETGSGNITRGVPLPLGKNGLFITFSQGTLDINDSWTVQIPNTQSSTYLTAYNSYQAALQTQTQTLTAAQSAVDSAQAALNQAQTNLQALQAAARPEDVAAAQAAVSAAQAQLQSAEVAYNNSIITAPLDGIITAVNIKPGETASTAQPAITMISNGTNGTYEIKASVSQADLPNIKINDPADVTLDAYGPDLHFNAIVTEIDPAATMVNNIPSYQVTLAFTQPSDQIKAGLNANIKISDQTHSKVLVVPASAILKRNGGEYVSIDAGSGKTEDVQVQTGLNGLDGNVEITSGISAGQKIINFGNN